VIVSSLYRCLLWLYPSSYRQEYGEEMAAVFCEARAEIARDGAVKRSLFWFREIYGLARGAVDEHVRALVGSHSWVLLPTRRFTVNSEFRFPKATAILMAVILAGTVLAIEKAQAISASLPHTNPPVGPIQPAHLTFLPPVLLMFAMAYGAGVIGWALLFALKRSGVHRLSGIQGSVGSD
jgi:hypothetical protein